MAVSFSGLATGLDTSSIINQLMNIERAPIARMEADKSWLNNRLSAFKEFDTRLNSFLESIETLNSRDQYNKKSATTSNTDFLSATASEDAIAGTNYNVEVVQLAQVQKSYTATGFTSKTDQDFGTGDLIINIDGVDNSITIDEDNNSLEGIMQAINDADIGVTASVISDGTDTPYHLTLTGQESGVSFTVDSTGLSGGSESLGDFSVSQTHQQAIVEVDGVPIYSNSNTIEDAIPGVTLNLKHDEAGNSTTLNISSNTNVITENIKTFISEYNEVISFVTGQSTMGDTSGGVLGGDSGLNSIKRHLQDLLTTTTNSDSTIKALSQLGLETQKNGTISLNSSDLSDAIEEDLDGVVSLLVGEEDGDGGLMTVFQEYLEGLTNSTDGVLAGRSESINRNISRIDDKIDQAEARLEKREETLSAQFMAMEQMVSLLNAQSSFLTTQLRALENMGISSE